MKENDYCIWLNGIKIYHASEIKDNFDLMSLRGYFLGGSLINWLKSHSGEEAAEYLNNIATPETGEVNGILEYAFGLRKNPPEINNCENEKNVTKHNKPNIRRSYPLTSGTVSFNIPASLNAGSGVFYTSAGFSGGSGIWNKSFSSRYAGSGNFTASFISGNDTAEILSYIEKYPLNKYGYGIHLI